MTADEIRGHIDPIRDQFAEGRSLILPALKFAQTEKGYLDGADLEAVGEAVGLTTAYVESVATFYDRLYLQPTGRRVISVCINLSCMLRGCDELLSHLTGRLGLPSDGGSTDDGAFTVQQAQCLGYCDRAPCLQVDVGETQGPMSLDDADALIEALRAAPTPDRLWR